MLRRWIVSAILVVSACAPAPDALRTIAIDVDGMRREFDLIVPTTATTGSPLVIVLHGLTGTSTEIRRLSGFDTIGRERGFVVAFPQALGFIPTWRANPAFGDADVRFLEALVEEVAAMTPVSAVFVIGFSNGGGMAARMGCERPDLVAGIGTVAGAFEEPPCLPDRPVPLLAFHGTADPIVPFDGVPGSLPAIPAWSAAWAESAECAGPVDLPPVDDIALTTWEGCTAPVTLVTVGDGGHAWPGSGRPMATDAISATEWFADFVETVLAGDRVYAPRP